jgi:hypothetical protein
MAALPPEVHPSKSGYMQLLTFADIFVFSTI